METMIDQEDRPDARYTDMALRLFGCKTAQCPKDSENAYLENQTERKVVTTDQILPNHAYVIPHIQGYTAFMTPDEGEMRRYDGGVLLLSSDVFRVSENKDPNGENVESDYMMNIRQAHLTRNKGILIPKEHLRKDIERKVGRESSE